MTFLKPFEKKGNGKNFPTTIISSLNMYNNSILGKKFQRNFQFDFLKNLKIFELIQVNFTSLKNCVGGTEI